MANNSTAFILPQWLLPKEPGMTCRPHDTIIGMLAIYNIVSTIVSVITAGLFFYWQKQQFWTWRRQIIDRFLPCISWGSSGEERSYGDFSYWSFVMSVLGSVGIVLTALLLAGISISKNHPNASRCMRIEQWSTRPRASVFVVVINGILAIANHREILEQVNNTSTPQEDGYKKTAVTAMFTEFCVGFFRIKFLWDQAQIRSSSLYQSSTPCTTLGTSEGDPSNCPDMETGANGWILAISLNGILSFFLSFLLSSKRWALYLLGSFLILEYIFLYSWEIWASFSHHATEDMYCIESSTPIDVIYCLLPVFLGIWRLNWSVGRRRDQPVIA
jgi:hypothetical protein